MVGKILSGGGPDLQVSKSRSAARLTGPSPTIKPIRINPFGAYTFPQAIVWKLGDPVSIKVIDTDWSDSTVVVLGSKPGDPLAMRLLSGMIRPTKGGPTTLYFASDFKMPVLPKPE